MSITSLLKDIVKTTVVIMHTIINFIILKCVEYKEGEGRSHAFT